jgi:hypothetical protein
MEELNLQQGMSITVYDSKRVELGEGTFLRKSWHPELKTTAYECREHTILAKGDHFVKIRGQTYSVRALKT